MRQRKSKKNAGQLRLLFLIMLLAAAIILTPHLARFMKSQPKIIGEEACYHARIAGQILGSGIPSSDNLAYSPRQYVFQPYHLALAGAGFFLGIENASIMLPFLCGMAGIALFYLILCRLGFSRLEIIASLCVFVLSPAAAYTFSVSSPACLAIILLLFGFYFFIKQGALSFAASILFFSAAAFASMSSIFTAFAAILAYFAWSKSSKKRFCIASLALLLILILHYPPDYIISRISGFYFGKTLPDFFTGFITDLGGILGFSIFGLMLSGLGIACTWASRRAAYAAYLIAFSSIILAAFYNPLTYYANFAAAVFAGAALSALIKRKWELKPIRNFSIILLFCGILFSAVSYNIRLSEQLPGSEIFEALEWLSRNSNEGDVVFSHYSNGFFIQYYSGRPSFSDSMDSFSNEFSMKMADSGKIFNSLDTTSAKGLLEKHNISFVLITESMYQGDPWKKQGEGLSYLLGSREYFIEEYSNKGASIWRYTHVKGSQD